MSWEHSDSVGLPFPPQRGKTSDFGCQPDEFRINSAPKSLTLSGSRLGCPATGAPLDRPGAEFRTYKVLQMAKAVTIKVKLVSSADTGFYYVAKKNSRTMTEKLVKKKYDPVARKHVEFREAKIK
jgi:large subunit ribosomal protein L33